MWKENGSALPTELVESISAGKSEHEKNLVSDPRRKLWIAY